MANRERTKFQGVYQRKHSTRRHLGKSDICYDITYKTPNAKKVWEKIGWTSEGYTAQFAFQVRAERIRTMRHGDLPHTNKMNRKNNITFAEAFELYKKDWLYQVKSAAKDVQKYNSYIAAHLKDKALYSITALDIERIKSTMLAKKYSAQTIKHALGLIKRIYRKLADWGVYTGNIPKFQMSKVDAARTRFLTKQEAQMLLDAEVDPIGWTANSHFIDFF